MADAQDEIDYRKFYDANIESYLLTEVAKRFHEFGEVTPFDFYLILHWKAPRSKNRTKERLHRATNGGFACAVKQITEALYCPSQPAKDRLKLLMEDWGFRLPTATAILTVLWPEEFTVYDRRVCDTLGDFHYLGARHFSDDLWRDYLSFKQGVIDEKPCDLSLRDKDRYLWGKSFFEQAQNDCRDCP
ncbi:MAG TPA: hypothetical protein VLI39_09870 [Sedimentisphaerales bacterium]|nr:hypothetical protein [Sedimentisphaerales bacterium]